MFLVIAPLMTGVIVRTYGWIVLLGSEGTVNYVAARPRPHRPAAEDPPHRAGRADRARAHPAAVHGVPAVLGPGRPGSRPGARGAHAGRGPRADLPRGDAAAQPARHPDGLGARVHADGGGGGDAGAHGRQGRADARPDDLRADDLHAQLAAGLGRRLRARALPARRSCCSTSGWAAAVPPDAARRIGPARRRRSRHGPPGAGRGRDRDLRLPAGSRRHHRLLLVQPDRGEHLSAHRLLAPLVREVLRHRRASWTRSGSACGSALVAAVVATAIGFLTAYGLVRSWRRGRGRRAVAGDAAHDGPAPPDQHLAPARAAGRARSRAGRAHRRARPDLPALRHRRASWPASRASTPSSSWPR